MAPGAKFSIITSASAIMAFTVSSPSGLLRLTVMLFLFAFSSMK